MIAHRCLFVVCQRCCQITKFQNFYRSLTSHRFNYQLLPTSLGVFRVSRTHGVRLDNFTSTLCSGFPKHKLHYNVTIPLAFASRSLSCLLCPVCVQGCLNTNILSALPFRRLDLSCVLHVFRVPRTHTYFDTSISVASLGYRSSVVCSGYLHSFFIFSMSILAIFHLLRKS